MPGKKVGTVALTWLDTKQLISKAQYSNVEAQSETLAVSAHQTQVVCMALNNDGTLLATAS